MKYLLYVAQNYSFAIVRPLQDELLKQGHQVKWFLIGEEINHSYLRHNEIQLNSVDEVKKYHPDVVLVPGNTVPSFIPGLKVAIFHGFNSGKRSDDIGHFAIRGCFDLYCTQGPNTTSTFTDKAQKYKYFRVIETGWPTLDPLYLHNPSPIESKKKPTILYCSTFSKGLTSTKDLYEEVKRLSQNSKWNWLIQFHPKMDKETVEKYKALQNENLSFIETDNVIPLLHQADVMLCDTSSILIMFLLLQKPVVTYKNNAPGEHLVNILDSQKLESSIEYALSLPQQLMDNIQKYCQQTHPYNDGHSSSRVVKAIEEVLEKPPLEVKKPLNLIRNFKLRKQLSYWKL